MGTLMHESEFAGFAEQFSAKNIRSIDTDSLFAQLDLAILNKGEAFGLLKLINPGDPDPGAEIIAIYTFIPNMLGHVGGIITEQPQTPLSHINLKARQNDTPNAYMKNVRAIPEVADLIGQWVHYSVNDEGVHIESATEQEAEQWLAGHFPVEATIPESDLSLTAPMPLTALSHVDWIRVGVKAANVAELGNILAEGIAPKGYALPFAMYDAFMRSPRCVNEPRVLCDNNASVSLYTYIERLLDNAEFNASLAVREQKLSEFRGLIEHAEVEKSLVDEIETVRLFWEPEGEPFTQKLRVRSSTNNEDLQGFSGAGLYGSFTHKPKEGKLIKSIKEVWAGLWTLTHLRHFHLSKSLIHRFKRFFVEKFSLKSMVFFLKVL
ncbi:PEP/pyruvate-binding domain-containing protein [Bathymodiolus japonicus methanotrophic gill symbiont]|uniref:PEP/pyruvate-binding domain-containing protein n=1 Tax=Bathymodiolus japonicus methanotrophic gill symbiont TaxID=113269 RepID=UPI001C8D06AF|nr:PEP/pyruvate-binding domain-containing protein [Bathymodiolus japonicus methanotrophic gill symbiont]